MSSLLGDLPGRTLDRLGDHAFLAQDGVRHQLSEVVDRAARVSTGLRTLGVRPGDRVGVVMTNSPDVLVAYLALWRAGAVAMPVIPAVTATELAHVLSDSEAVAVLCSPASLPLATEAAAGIPVLPSLDPLVEEPGDVVPRADDDLAALLYTGGTTGRAKGVMLSQRNLHDTAAARQQVVATARTSSVLVPLPLSHVFGLINVVSRLHVTEPGTLHLQGRFDAAEWVRIVERERIEASAVVPSMLQLLLAQPLEDADLSSLTYVTSGGAPLALAVRQEFERRVSTARVCDGYGCTEVCSTATMNPPDARRDDSVGQPLPGVRLRIADDREVLVSSPGVMTGYWRDPEATASAVQDGWLRTGDVGRLDEDGYLFVVDRIKDLIIRGGFNVYPRDVEDALLEHPSVSAAAVVGRPDPVLGEEVVAYVELIAPAEPGDLLAFAAQRLAKTKQPRELYVVDKVPLTSVGKTDRKAVRRLLT